MEFFGIIKEIQMSSKYVISTKDNKYKFSHFSYKCSCFVKSGGLKSDNLDEIKELLLLIHSDFKLGNDEFLSLDRDDIIPNDLLTAEEEDFVLDGDENFETVRLLKLKFTPNDLKIYKEIVDIRYEEINE